MKNQTAVKWLIEQINQDYPKINWEFRIECAQAKAIERDQMLELISFVRVHNKMGKTAEDLLEQFETYKGGEQ